MTKFNAFYSEFLKKRSLKNDKKSKNNEIDPFEVIVVLFCFDLQLNFVHMFNKVNRGLWSKIFKFYSSLFRDHGLEKFVNLG